MDITTLVKKITVGYVGFGISALLFAVAHVLNLPVWFDLTGTIFATVAGGWVCGLIVGILVSLFLCIYFMSWQSIFFFGAVLFPVIVTWLLLGKKFRIEKMTTKKFLIGWFDIGMTKVALVLLTNVVIWSISGMHFTNDAWSETFSSFFINNLGAGTTLAAVLAIILTNIIDMLVVYPLAMIAVATYFKHVENSKIIEAVRTAKQPVETNETKK
ncbi:MAG: hypothetical protein LBM13_02770 [Candidatus Ancillula sp.]|jgi:MFS family permease|nr:hypothetical protein [Candidatus Ancillula sp.]